MPKKELVKIEKTNEASSNDVSKPVGNEQKRKFEKTIKDDYVLVHNSESILLIKL